ncbi:hypothetical protein HNO88_000293 [Novosphingobium chloroacetimidivorans]|uniref:Uncharacterized protein n=1 Tax=Novosphingobium chloroacetimidivorans TaxID=1428314 RepID=A0A7W7K6W8_9SPHN|nr:hypothetical protein [Novosphingobium chloroacetimidivorans]MBB4856996.1 hypothetical protein [Novosphingobium chloroacetimidivorans]
MAFMSNPNSGGEGNFKVYVKYNAKAGRWYTKKDEKDAPEFEVTNMTAIFDMENIRTGWFLFAAGVAPAKTYDPSLSQAAAKPGDGFKRGFELDVFSEKNLLGVREFSSTAGVVIEAMNALHDHWEAEKGANPGKLPVVKCAGVAPIVGSHGTNYQPQLEIVGWADRPADLNGSAPAATPAAAPAPAPAAKAEHAPPPAARAPEPATADDVEF